MRKEPIRSIRGSRTRVIVYGVAGFPKCEALRRYLSDRGIPVRWKDVAQNELAMTELAELTGGRAPVPVVVIGKNVLIDPDPRQWTSILRKVRP